jgi:threonine dehydrogenase-like Zn-dependent dehydrogenase
MRALAVQPGRTGAPQVADAPEPVPGEHDLLVDGLAVGVCGTDREIVAGEYGSAGEAFEPQPNEVKVVIIPGRGVTASCKCRGAQSPLNS